LLVAIDGPAGAGKSTVARGVARELGFTYLDSGAMYRCVALLSLAAPHAEPGELARAARIEFVPDGGGGRGDEGRGHEGGQRASRTLLDGRDVSVEIRTPAVAQAASLVARDSEVRIALVAKQRALIASGDWVAEGRDIGTVVAPDSELKVFLTASAEVRARRRAAELGVDSASVQAEQAVRDERDETREHSPLTAAPGAIMLDTSELSVEEVVARIAELARAARPA
jgi:cytidylate kinase